MSSQIPKLPEISYFLEKNQVYVGLATNGSPEGQGTLTLPNQGKTLKGFFRDGEFTKGTLIFEDGSSFKGNFRGWNPIKKGVLNIPNVMKISTRFDIDN